MRFGVLALAAFSAASIGTAITVPVDPKALASLAARKVLYSAPASPSAEPSEINKQDVANLVDMFISMDPDYMEPEMRVYRDVLFGMLSATGGVKRDNMDIKLLMAMLDIYHFHQDRGLHGSSFHKYQELIPAVAMKIPPILRTFKQILVADVNITVQGLEWLQLALDPAWAAPKHPLSILVPPIRKISTILSSASHRLLSKVNWRTEDGRDPPWMSHLGFSEQEIADFIRLSPSESTLHELWSLSDDDKLLAIPDIIKGMPYDKEFNQTYLQGVMTVLSAVSSSKELSHRYLAAHIKAAVLREICALNMEVDIGDINPCSPPDIQIQLRGLLEFPHRSKEETSLAFNETFSGVKYSPLSTPALHDLLEYLITPYDRLQTLKFDGKALAQRDSSVPLSYSQFFRRRAGLVIKDLLRNVYLFALHRLRRPARVTYNARWFSKYDNQTLDTRMAGRRDKNGLWIFPEETPINFRISEALKRPEFRDLGLFRQFIAFDPADAHTMEVEGTQGNTVVYRYYVEKFTTSRREFLYWFMFELNGGERV